MDISRFFTTSMRRDSAVTEDAMIAESSIDTMAKTLATTRTRRGMLRLLGGAALNGAIGLAGLDVVGAKNGKMPKKVKKCKPGKLIGTISIPANGDKVQTPALKKGQRYRIRVSGFVVANGIHGIDADYLFVRADPQKRSDTFAGVNHGVSIDGNEPDWGVFSPSHVYEQIRAGEGRFLTLWLVDGNYANNSGSMTVEIMCG